MIFLSEQDFANFETIEQEVNQLVYFKLVNIGPNTINKENREPAKLLALIKTINGRICLPNNKEELKGEICQMIDKIYEER